MGEKLQALVDANCIAVSFAQDLTDTQKAAIENLSWSQIWALKEARAAVGPVTTAQLI